MIRFASFTCLVITLSSCFAGCAPARPALETYHRLDATPVELTAFAPALTAQAYAELLADLRPGDMVLAVCEDPITPVVRLGTMTPSYFTHSAIVDIREKVNRGTQQREVIAWHAIGDFNLLNLSPHLLGKVRGGVRSIALDDLIRMYDALLFVRLPDETKNALMADVCRRLHDANVAFDTYMNCVDDSEVCCTELNAIAMREAGYTIVPEPAARTTAPELDALMTELNVTSPAIYAAAQFEDLPGGQVVAVISRYGRMETYLAMRDASELIHQRFVDGAVALGDLSGFDRNRMVHYTDRMELFLRGVEGLAKSSPTNEVAEIRRRNEVVFGAVYGNEVEPR